jgi:hypothetical protein
MKRNASIIVIMMTMLLTGCLEMTQELTVNKDGSGTLSSTTDMSQVMSMVIQMAGDKIGDQKFNMDTTIGFKSMLDSIKDLSPANRELLKNGLVHVVMKMDDNKYLVNSSVPFKKMADVDKINQAMQKEVNGKFLDNAMKEAMKENKGLGDSSLLNSQPGTPKMSLPENYFILTCKDGMISRSANKEKMKTLADDETLNQMKQMSSMGAPLKTNLVINLPRPAKKVEGKNVQLSGDKKKITIENELNDLYEDPSLFEFKVEY